MTRSLLSALILLFALLIPVPGQDPAIPPGHVLVDDMILPEEVVFGDSAFTANPWPVGVVAYVFNSNVSAANQVQARKAMDEISAVSRVIFVPRTAHPDWIIFNATTFNSSLVGMQGGGQTINITSWGTKYIIVHEIMHALGFIHEHSRPDRNAFVTVNAGNISTIGCPGSNCGGNGSSSCVCNFNIVNGATQATPYDFLSIMHYGRNAFSSNGGDTLTCQPAFASFQNQIGNRTFMSLGDAQGLAQRYGSTVFFPAITSITPTTVTTAQGGFTLHVYGSGFFEGSPNASGIQGSKILWNGSQLTTTYVDSGHLTAQVAASLISQPQTVQVTVTNPPPAWGPLFTTLPLSVVCASGGLALSNGVPTTTTNGCQQFSISPVYSAFNVIGVTSPGADWDIQMGTASAAAGGNACDFVVGTGWAGPGTIQPTTGNVTFYSGSGPATLQHVTSTEMLNGQPTIAAIPAGSIVRAFHFSAAAVSTRTIQVAGPSYLRWKLLWSGNGFSWRSSTTNVTASGVVGGGPVSGIGIVPAPYCLVVYSDGTPVPTSESLTISMCFDFTPTALASSNNITTINQGAYSCVPFAITPLTGKWNVVGVSSPTDWDLQIGGAVSQFGGSSCDYVLANGHHGAISPVTGVCSPFAFPGSPGSLQFAPTAALPFNWYSYTYMILAFEFEILSPGNYDIAVAGAPGYFWDFHRPGNSAGWRRAADRNGGPYAVGGAAATLTNLSPGWHCVVVYHNGGPTGLVSPSISVGTSASPAPVLSSITPNAAPAGSGSLNLTASGSSFTTASVVLWNGTPLPTTFAGSTQLVASVSASLLVASGSVAVSVSTPGSGTSGTQAFTIGDPIPTLASLNPNAVPAGSPTVTMIVGGTGFVPTSVVRWNGNGLPTSFVSPTQLQATIDTLLFGVAGTVTVNVATPPPSGGVSGGLTFSVLAPTLTSTSPSAIASMAPNSPPLTLTLTGTGFHAGSRVYATSDPLPTVFVNSTTLQASLGPTVDQTQFRGGIAITVENTRFAISDSRVVTVGGAAANRGTVVRYPLNPQPGEAYSALFAGGSPGGLLTVLLDATNPTPLHPWPDPVGDFVLSVRPSPPTTPGWLPLLDGIGLYGPAQGISFNSAGRLLVPGFIRPNPALGVNLTVQGVFLDPTAPTGYRLMWARFPDEL